MALSNEAEKILAEQELRTKHMIAQSTQKGGDATYLSGEIVATSNENITIKVPEGENKVIFLSSETTIMRSTKGKQDDIVTGALISLSGTTNPDGSVNAKSIQLRPEASR